MPSQRQLSETNDRLLKSSSSKFDPLEAERLMSEADPAISVRPGPEASTHTLRPAQVLSLQRAIGNWAVQRMLVQREGKDGGTGPSDAGVPGGAPPVALVATLRRLLAGIGVDVAQIQTAIRNAPAAELTAVVADAALMSDLRDNLTAPEYATVERMLTRGLLGENSFTNTTDTGNKYTSLMALFRSGLTISKEVKFIKAGTFAAGGFEALRGRVIASVTSYLSNKYKLKIESPGGTPQEGDGTYAIQVQVTSNDSASYPMTLHGGAHGRSGVTEAAGDIYELGQASESSVPDITLAHESAHMILGASDEYANAAVTGRVVYTDHSLMGHFYNEGIAAAEIKARHFKFLVALVSAWFPGRTISIVK